MNRNLQVALGAFAFSLTAALAYPVFQKPSVNATYTRCAFLQHKAAQANILYAADFDDHFPPISRWQGLLEARARIAIECPAVKHAHAGVAFNFALKGLTLSSVDAKSTVLTFDTENLQRNASQPTRQEMNPPRHGGNNRSFVDGHVKLERQ